MKKTTYIEGLKLVYSDQVIDCRGVARANRQNQAEALKPITEDEHMDLAESVASELLQRGLDERGLWHTPNPELICLDDHRSMSWIGLRNGCILGAAFGAGVVLVVWLAT